MSQQQRRERVTAARWRGHQTRTTLGTGMDSDGSYRHELPAAIGECVAGKYVVEGVLGEGGMGVVLAARHENLDHQVAIKFLLPDVAQRSAATERFRREARVFARLRSEHTCRIFDIGTLPSGIPFMVMEYLEGRDIAHEIEQRGHVPYREAVGYILQACDALQEAHEAGIVHRDLKPANLFLERRDRTRRVKVLDFGVSKSLLEDSETHQTLTQTASLVGSSLYMSPEQLQSARDIDARVDIWALGAVLYELIAGRPPFVATTIPQLIAAVLHTRPVPLQTAAGPQVPAELDAIVLRALSKDRADRQGSVAELAEALLRFSDDSGDFYVSARTVNAAPFSGTQHDPRPDSPRQHSLQSPRRSMPSAWWIWLLLASAIALGGVLAYRGGYGAARPEALQGDNTEAEIKLNAATAVTPITAPPSPAAAPTLQNTTPAAQAASADSAALSSAAPPEATQATQTTQTIADEVQSPEAASRSTGAVDEARPRPQHSPKQPPAPTERTEQTKPAQGSKPALEESQPTGAPPRGQISDFGGRR